MKQRKREQIDTTQRRLVKTEGASEYTTLAVSTLEKLRLSGGGPRFVKLGGRAIAYDLRDLDSWIDSQRRVSCTSE